MADNITEKDFKAFLEELSVVIADIGAGHSKEAWKHYNDFIFDIKTKTIKLKGDK